MMRSAPITPIFQDRLKGKQMDQFASKPSPSSEFFKPQTSKIPALAMWRKHITFPQEALPPGVLPTLYSECRTLVGVSNAGHRHHSPLLSTPPTAAWQHRNKRTKPPRHLIHTSICNKKPPHLPRPALPRLQPSSLPSCP